MANTCPHCNSRCRHCDEVRYLADKINRKIKQGNNNDLPAELGNVNINQVREFIERQFKEGMNWDNHGKLWHIGHKTPIKSPRNGTPPSIRMQKSRLYWKNLEPHFKKLNCGRGKTDLGKM